MRARIPGLAIVSTLLVIGGLVAYCTAMPGSSFRGRPPLPTESERAVAEQLRADVKALAVDVGERRATYGVSLANAERYLTGRLRDAARGAPVRREPLRDAPGSPANLVLELPGTTAGPIVLVGAHYDSALGGTPGADDNASGVASALALAKHVARTPHALPVRIVLFANEEQPYYHTPAMGSLQHAAGCRERQESLRAVFALETMGYFSELPGSQHYPAPLDRLYPDRGNFIAFVGDLRSRPLVREVVRLFRENATIPSEGAALPEVLPGVGWSDHWAFWQHGFPAVMVTDTAPFRNPNYHEVTDVPATLDYERLARVVTALERTLDALTAA